MASTLETFLRTSFRDLNIEFPQNFDEILFIGESRTYTYFFVIINQLQLPDDDMLSQLAEYNNKILALLAGPNREYIDYRFFK